MLNGHDDSTDVTGCAVVARALLGFGEATANAAATELHDRLSYLSAADQATFGLAIRASQAQAFELSLSLYENWANDRSVLDAATKAKFLAEAPLLIRQWIEQPQNFRDESSGGQSFIRLQDYANPRALESALLSDLQTGVELSALNALHRALSVVAIPQSYLFFFGGDSERRFGFFDAFFIYLGWRLKTEESLARVIFAPLESLKNASINESAFSDALFDDCTSISQRFDRIIKKTSNILSADVAQESWAPFTPDPNETRRMIFFDLMDTIADANGTPKPVLGAAFEALEYNVRSPSLIEKALIKVQAQYNELRNFLTHLAPADSDARSALAAIENGDLAGVLVRLAPHDQTTADAPAKATIRGLAYAILGENKASIREFLTAFKLTPDTEIDQKITCFQRVIDQLMQAAEHAEDANLVEEAAKLVWTFERRFHRRTDTARWAKVKLQGAQALMVMGDISYRKLIYQKAQQQYEIVLGTLTFEKHPDLWLNGSANMARVLIILSERDKSADLSKQALDIARDIETKCVGYPNDNGHRDRCLLLAKCERAHSALLNDADMRRSSASMYERVLGEYADTPPFERAEILGELGAAYQSLMGGDGTSDISAKALIAYERALTVMVLGVAPEAAPLLSSVATLYFARRGERAGVLQVNMARDAYTLARSILIDAGSPMQFGVERGLGKALAWLASATKKRRDFIEAAEALERALSLCSREARGLFWASIQHEIGLNYLAFAAQHDDVYAASRAVDAFDEALLERTLPTYEALWRQSSLEQDKARKILDALTSQRRAAI
ncbi:MAG: hypothetical protein SGJ17_01140 [Hyphomicrobiales bacterium]|nr:hypothetical protein [Hyphomicrobiales bacterium]